MNKLFYFFFIIVVLLLSLSHCALILTSPDFKNGEKIPGDYGCDILNAYDRGQLQPSPPLSWTRPPVKVQSFILMLEDIDDNGKVLWLVKDIPRDISQLPIGASGISMPENSIELSNSFGFIGYAGPCPFNETHAYRFRLFAMDTPKTELIIPSNSSDISSTLIDNQIGEKAIYCAVLTGEYYAPNPCPVKVRAGELCPCPGPKCPLSCPVTLPEDGICPCPGPKCPLNQNIEKIRYVKPSESLRPHLLKVNSTTFESVKSIINSNPLDCVNQTNSNRAQTVEAADPIFPVRKIPSANSMIEDVPMPIEEQKKRKIKTFSWGVVQPETLVQLQTKSKNNYEDFEGLNEEDAEKEAEIEAENAANGMMENESHEGDEINWGNLMDDDSLSANKKEMSRF